MTRRLITIVVEVEPDNEDNLPAVPALQRAIEEHALNPGEQIVSITEWVDTESVKVHYHRE